MARAYLHVTPEALGNMPFVPARIVGTADCMGICSFVIEGDELYEGAVYICHVERTEFRKTAELRRVP